MLTTISLSQLLTCIWLWYRCDPLLNSHGHRRETTITHTQGVGTTTDYKRFPIGFKNIFSKKSNSHVRLLFFQVLEYHIILKPFQSSLDTFFPLIATKEVYTVFPTTEESSPERLLLSSKRLINGWVLYRNNSTRF